jgi:hypothetical protein
VIGKAAICSQGRPGLITGHKRLPWGDSWVGIGLDAGTQWASRSPRLLTDAELYDLGELAKVRAA